MPNPPTIAVITTCKGRLHHLRETLPGVAAQAPDELIVVDYSCPDRAGEWVEAEFPDARVVRVPDADGFHLGRARNHGAAAATAEWLLFVDADVQLAPTMLEFLRGVLQPNHFYGPRADPGSDCSQIWGTFVGPREAFAAIGGYDEVIEGWGHEDEDLYRRLQVRGLERDYYPPELLSPIPHHDSERAVLGSARDRWENEAANACYAMAKREISRIRGGDGNLPLEERRQILHEARRIVAQWYGGGARQKLPVRFVLGGGAPVKLASQVRMRPHTVVTVVIDPADFPGVDAAR